MSKLITMEQAASMLGMSVEKINELRSNQEIFGYKDGGTWKFKMTELHRVADNLGISLGGLDDVAGAVAGKAKSVTDSFDDLDFGDSEDLLLDDSSSGSMEIDIDEDSSVELMQSGRSSDIFLDLDDEDGVTLEDSGLLLADSGTGKDFGIVGDKKDDDLVIAGSDEIDLADSGSLKLQGESSLELSSDDTAKSIGDSKLNLGDSGVLELGTGSEILEDDDQLSFGTSDISLAGSSKILKGDDDTGSDVLSGGEVTTSDSPSATGKLLSEGDDDLLLAEEDLFEDDLVLQDSSSFDDSSDLGSEFSDDLVLDDSDSSSELALEANESGISLSANESGISLADEPLELGGSDIDELELPGDDMIMLEKEADPAMAMMQEDDFNLTPLEQSADGGEGDGSSSQVIVLEDSEIFADESEATILGDADGAFGDPALVEDSYAEAGVGLVGGAALVGAGAMAPGMMTEEETVAYSAPAVAREADYSIGSLLGLGLAASVLLLGAILAFDTCRNLWMNDGQVVSSGFLDMVITAFGMKN